jgi:endoplasmic reticulum-Golgi intermediate compartment protein 2
MQRYVPILFWNIVDSSLVLSIDLRDAVGDRLHLSDTFKKDGVSPHLPLTSQSLNPTRPSSMLDKPMISSEQPTHVLIFVLNFSREHQRRLSTREIVAASRRSRGFFSLFKANRPQFKKTWNHTPDGSACRVYGSVSVRKLSGTFHHQLHLFKLIILRELSHYDPRTWVWRA